MPSLFKELRRRNVVKVCLAYLAMAWLLLQVADTVLSAFDAAPWVLQALIIVFAVGLPIVIGVAWVFELTPDGVMRTDEIPASGRVAKPKGRKLDFAIIALLSLALVAVVVDQYVIEPPSALAVSRLAVLPLRNVSGDPEQQYFADGFTEALITNLANISALRVVPRTSVMRFAETERSLTAIAAELDVDAIVTGSVTRNGDQIQVAVQLEHVRNDEVIWGTVTSRDFSEVFLVQSEIAQAIAREAHIAITPQEESRLTQSGAAIADGYDDYLRGMQFFYRLTPADLETALQYFDLALEKNPKSPLAHSGVAATWIGLQQMGFVRSSEATPKAEAAALRALELDPDLAQPHLWLAIVRGWGDWNWVEAERLFLRAIELNPSYADIRGSYGHLLAVAGRFDEALEQFAIALEQDPFNPWIIGEHGVVYHMMGRYEEAIKTFHEALRIAPDLPFVWLVLAGSYHQTGQFDEAVAAESSLFAAVGDVDAQREVLRVYESDGYQQAMTWVAARSASFSETSGTLGWWVAFRYAHASQDERVFEWLQRALAQRDPNLPFMRMPEFSSLHDDPRFRAVMQLTGIL